jgi:uroporphyrin-III C-methyltransferase
MSTTGKVYLVGAGPGAPDLLTLRAARILEAAEVVFHDALVHPDTLLLAAHAHLIPVGKRCGQHSTAQHFINKRLVDAAHQYKVVVRLKGGDPMLFGRAQEEIEALAQAGIDVEVVPGVTTALAAAAQLRRSLTRRGVSRNVCIVTPRVGSNEDPSDWARSVLAADTSVIYMGGGDMHRIVKTLLEGGMKSSTPATIIENVSLDNSREITCTLGSLKSASAGLGAGPTVIILGEVAGLSIYARAPLVDPSFQAQKKA